MVLLQTPTSAARSPAGPSPSPGQPSPTSRPAGQAQLALQRQPTELERRVMKVTPRRRAALAQRVALANVTNGEPSRRSWVGGVGGSSGGSAGGGGSSVAADANGWSKASISAFVQRTVSNGSMHGAWFLLARLSAPLCIAQRGRHVATSLARYPAAALKRSVLTLFDFAGLVPNQSDLHAFAAAAFDWLCADEAYCKQWVSDKDGSDRQATVRLQQALLLATPRCNCTAPHLSLPLRFRRSLLPLGTLARRGLRPLGL